MRFSLRVIAHRPCAEGKRDQCAGAHPPHSVWRCRDTVPLTTVHAMLSTEALVLPVTCLVGGWPK